MCSRIAVALVGLHGLVGDFRASAVPVYFGSGCFWGRQHDFVEDFERTALRRADGDVTAVGGYAGSARAGADGTVCYENPLNHSVYTDLGHAEVVQVDVPLNAAFGAFDLFYRSFIQLDDGIWAREDFFDVGPAYRAMVGLPGGLQRGAPELLEALHSANLHNMTLREGRGSDEDTLGKNLVFVMDSDQFGFHQAELCLQFRNNQTGNYPASYHALKTTLEAAGRLRHTGCPGNYVCNSTLAPLPTMDVLQI
mmetsp:Transcript_27695/g.89095  ORF Transcript_27695/g.89095 Transcript_27695/m.89095 type:complete len:252 (+) Transcript_27695:89-844(+)